MFDDKYTSKYRVTLSGIVLLHFALQNIFVAVSSVHIFLRIGYGVLHLYLGGFGCL